MVRFVTIEQTVMVDDMHNAIIYMQTIPVNLEHTLTTSVRPIKEDCHP